MKENSRSPGPLWADVHANKHSLKTVPDKQDYVALRRSHK